MDPVTADTAPSWGGRAKLGLSVSFCKGSVSQWTKPDMTPEPDYWNYMYVCCCISLKVWWNLTASWNIMQHLNLTCLRFHTVLCQFVNDLSMIGPNSSNSWLLKVTDSSIQKETHAFGVIFAVSYAEHRVARGNKNDNNTFHFEELQVFARPSPVCTRPDDTFTAHTQLIHSYRSLWRNLL